MDFAVHLHDAAELLVLDHPPAGSGRELALHARQPSPWQHALLQTREAVAYLGFDDDVEIGERHNAF